MADDVTCVQCEASVPWLDRMQVYVPVGDKLIYPLCRPCFDVATAHSNGSEMPVTGGSTPVEASATSGNTPSPTSERLEK